MSNVTCELSHMSKCQILDVKNAIQRHAYSIVISKHLTFTKISLYKLLLFANKQTRVDYFKQQSDFIRVEGRKDEYAEFSTHLDGKDITEIRKMSFLHNLRASRLTIV